MTAVLVFMAVWITACAIMDIFGADFGNAYTMAIGYVVATIGEIIAERYL